MFNLPGHLGIVAASGKSLAGEPLVFSATDKTAGMTIGGGGTIVTKNNNFSDQVARSVKGHNTGKRYFEVEVLNWGGTNAMNIVGVLELADPLSSVGTASNTTGLRGHVNPVGAFATSNNRRYVNSALFGGPSATFNRTAPVRYGFAIDLDVRRFWAHVDGVWHLGETPSNSAGAGPINGSNALYAVTQMYPPLCQLQTVTPTPAWLPAGFLGWEV